MSKMSLNSIYGCMASNNPELLNFSEIAEKLERELSKKIYGCITCSISDFTNNILVCIDFLQYRYRINIPIDFSSYRDVNAAVSQLAEYVSKQYFDMVYKERFRK